MNGGDWRWSRYSPLDQINAANFNKLEVAWRTEPFQPAPDVVAAADSMLEKLRERGSPSHDGFAAGLVAWEADGGGLRLELQRDAAKQELAGVTGSNKATLSEASLSRIWLTLTSQQAPAAKKGGMSRIDRGWRRL